MVSAQATAELGTTLVGGLAIVEANLVAIIAPALTMFTIAGEKQRGTYELLRATPLSSDDLLIGTVAGATALIAILSISTLPFYAVIATLGGVSAFTIFSAKVLLIGSGAVYASLGAMMSCRSDNVAGIVARTYATQAAMIFLPIASCMPGFRAPTLSLSAGTGFSCAWFLLFSIASAGSGVFPLGQFGAHPFFDLAYGMGVIVLSGISWLLIVRYFVFLGSTKLDPNRAQMQRLFGISRIMWLWGILYLILYNVLLIGLSVLAGSGPSAGFSLLAAGFFSFFIALLPILPALLDSYATRFVGWEHSISGQRGSRIWIENFE